MMVPLGLFFSVLPKALSIGLSELASDAFAVGLHM